MASGSSPLLRQQSPTSGVGPLSSTDRKSAGLGLSPAQSPRGTSPVGSRRQSPVGNLDASPGPRARLGGAAPRLSVMQRSGSNIAGGTSPQMSPIGRAPVAFRISGDSTLSPIEPASPDSPGSPTSPFSPGGGKVVRRNRRKSQEDDEPKRAGAAAFAKRRATVESALAAKQNDAAKVSGLSGKATDFLRRKTLGDMDDGPAKPSSPKAKRPPAVTPTGDRPRRQRSKEASGRAGSKATVASHEQDETKLEEMADEKKVAHYEKVADDYRRRKVNALTQKGKQERDDYREYLKVKEMLRESNNNGKVKADWDAVHAKFRDEEAFDRVRGVHHALGNPKMLEAMDRMVLEVRSNKNGLKTVFQEMDTDGNGILSKAELGKGLRTMGVSLLPVELSAVMRIFDNDGSDSIEFSEFSLLLEKHEALRLLHGEREDDQVDLMLGYSKGDRVKAMVTTNVPRMDAELYELGEIVGPGVTRDTLKIKLNDSKQFVNLKPRQFELIKKKLEPKRTQTLPALGYRFRDG